MKRGVRAAAHALAIGLAWGIAWAPIAVLIGTLVIDPDNSMDEMWAAIGAYPGFLSGVGFCVLVALAERGRRPGDLPLSRATTWGALSGALVGLVPFASSTPRSLGAATLACIAGMSAISAAATVAWLRRAARKRSVASAEPAA